MTNAWSLLYDELTMKQPWVYESPDGGKTVTRRKPGSLEKEMISPHSEDRIELSVPDYEFTLDTMTNNNPNHFKYSEEELLKELKDYISATYNAHYSAGNDAIQTLDLIEACGDAEAFCRSNILKYASRYDKKGTARRDIIKILHYGLLLLHFSDKSSKRETYPQ